MALVECRAAQAADLEAVLGLLQQCGLPVADLTAAHLQHFVLAWADGALIGSAGIEPAGSTALLRSVAVRPAQRSQGVARRLVQRCEQQAADAGLTTLVMIAGSEAAARYFAGLGYAPVLREQLAPELLALPEFAGLCPKSNPCLAKTLPAAGGVTIYHNPACGTSRNVLAMIRNAGINPAVIEYLSSPPDRATLVRLIADAGLSVRGALREKCEPYEQLGLKEDRFSDEELLDFIAQHPILMNRPFVVTALGTRLCRPSEVVLDILPAAQQGAFSKEDGEAVIDASGTRLK